MQVTSSRDVLVEVTDLKKLFEIRGSFFSRGHKYLHAVDGVTFEIRRGEIFALAGESGCGKTTCGKLLVRLLERTSGDILFEGKSLYSLRDKGLLEFRRKAHMIYQNPYESFNPRYTVRQALHEPLNIHKIKLPESKIEKTLETVGLTPPEHFMDVYVRELSGGQRQRVSIARALVLEPEFIVADEPVSMLDVSIKAGILKLLLDIRKTTNMTYVFITHDLSSALYLADHLAIMYLGSIVEMGRVDKAILNTKHPYASALISAVPIPDPTVKRSIPKIKGMIPSPVDLPLGCTFYNRCVYAKDVCKAKRPDLVEIEKEHYAACHLLK
jgi:peptide/nickel transport system ATP-binding protein